MHTQRGVLTSDFLFFRPGKIILALLRCSLQSLGEYLKRPDQSASGQFHQHLNTRLLFLREPFYLSFPFSASLLQSSFLSLFLFFSSLLFRIYLNNLRPFGSLCVNYRLAKRAEESEMRERGERVGKFSKVLAEMRSVKGMRADNVDLPKDTRSDGLFVDSRIS